MEREIDRRWIENQNNIQIDGQKNRWMDLQKNR